MKLRESVSKKIDTLRLNGIQDAFSRQLENDEWEEKGFLERLDNLLEEEVINKENRRIASLLKRANLRLTNATLSNMDYSLMPSVKPAKINDLAQLDWINNKRHLILTGATGAGKTYLACALARTAILEGIPVLFFRYNQFLLHLVCEQRNETLSDYFKKLVKIPLIVLDDWGNAPLDVEQRHLLFEFIENRDQRGSVLITSQYGPSDWHAAFQNQTIADSVLDRIIHNSHKVNMTHESVRKILGVKEK